MARGFLRKTRKIGNVSRASSASEILSAKEKAINYKVGTEFNLVSQASGKITSLQVKPGAAVAAARTLGIMMPEDSSLLAELWIPSSAIVFVSTGTEVRLMYQAFPYQKFDATHAKVIKIANSPTAPEDLPTRIAGEGRPVSNIGIVGSAGHAAYGKSLPLVPEMQLEADLILDKRSLLDWLLDPLLAKRTRNQ